MVIIHPQVPGRNVACLEDVHLLPAELLRMFPHPRMPTKGVLPPFLIPITLSPFPSPRIHGLSLNIKIATREQVCREAAPYEIIPFSSSDVALRIPTAEPTPGFTS